MRTNNEKPSPEAKALSLFLMAFKEINPSYKEKSKYMNKRWEMVKVHELSKKEYIEEVHKLLASYGGYSEVVEKTVRFYIEKTGEWKLKGDDQYCQDALLVANKLMNK